MIDLPLIILLIEIVALPYVVYNASKEIRHWLSDYIRIFRKKDHQVRTTLLKYMIYENRTEAVKLRRVRAHRKISTLSIDPMPTVIHENDEEHRARLETHYSVPGMSVRTEGNKLQILLEKDEELKAHNDHSVMVGYIIKGSPSELFREPGVLVTQPVGSERLVVKVHFPPGWNYLRLEDSKAKIEVYTEKTPGLKDHVPDKQLSIKGDSFDFGDERGETDWFRATISRPPQDADIHVKWHWDEATKKALNETHDV